MSKCGVDEKKGIGMPRTNQKIAVIVILILPMFALTFWIGGQVVKAINVVQICRSQGEFGQLRLILLGYYNQHGCFPPTKYQATPDGPIHSWRVLLLPYIDMYTAKLYSRYDFSQPWNSPDNLEIAKAAERHLGHFSIDNPGIANYLAIGDGDDWPSKGPLSARLITKGKDHFLLVEYPESDIYWTEPKY